MVTYTFYNISLFFLNKNIIEYIIKINTFLQNACKEKYLKHAKICDNNFLIWNSYITKEI